MNLSFRLLRCEGTHASSGCTRQISFIPAAIGHWNMSCQTLLAAWTCFEAPIRSAGVMTLASLFGLLRSRIFLLPAVLTHQLLSDNRSSVLLKDTLTRPVEEPGIELPITRRHACGRQLSRRATQNEQSSHFLWLLLWDIFFLATLSPPSRMNLTRTDSKSQFTHTTL